MHKSQRELRRAAAQKFIQSLGQLEGMLEEQAQTPSDSASTSPTAGNSPAIDLSAFEEAVADIEEYMQGKDKP